MLTKKWASAAILAVAVMSLAACSGTSAAKPTASSAGGSAINLSLIGPLTGAFADTGTQFKEGAQVAINEINASGGVLKGRKLSFSSSDTAAGPQQSAQVIRDLTSNGHKLIFGELSSANCLADAPLLQTLGAVMITNTCTNQALTGQDGAAAPYPGFFRVGATDIADMVALYKTMNKEFPKIKTYDAFVFDYVSGHEEWTEFQDGLKSLGNTPKIGQQIFVPLTQQNYGSEISNLAAASKGGTKRGLYLGTYGSGTGSFINQSSSYNLFSNYDVVVNPGSYYPIARGLNGAAPEVWNGYDYNYKAYNTPENKSFVKAFNKLYKQNPDTFAYQSYLAVRAYGAAIQKAKSDDPAAVTKALAGISFSAPQGKYTINAKTHQGTANIVVTDTVGDSTQPDGVKVKKLVVVPFADTKQ